MTSPRCAKPFLLAALACAALLALIAPARAQETPTLERCRAAAEAAAREPDAEAQRALFAAAERDFRGLLDAAPTPALGAQAARAYLDLVTRYARVLAETAADASDEEASALRATLARVLDEGIARTGALASASAGEAASAGQGAGERREAWRVLLARGELWLARGGLADDPAADLARAADAFEAVAREAGATSGPGLAANLALARVARARGDLAAASERARFVATTAVPEDAELARWKTLSFPEKEQRFRLLELALPELVETLAARGERHAAGSWALAFANTARREGFALSPTGTLARLAAARALFDSAGFVGGAADADDLRWFASAAELGAAGFAGDEAHAAPEVALAWAREVRAANAGNLLARRARRLIADVLARADDALPAEARLAVARDDFERGDFAAAVDALASVERALAGRGDDARRALMPEVELVRGRSYAALGRPREAAAAFRAGATTWAGDPEFQPALAEELYRALAGLARAAPDDEELAAELVEAERLVAESARDGDADVIRWRQAQRAFARADYAAARASYLAVGAAADEHEKALVEAARCLLAQGDAAGARRELADYLDVFVPDAHHALADVPANARRRAARAEARARATYTLAALARDAGEPREVLARLAGFERDFGAQVELVPGALALVLDAEIALHDLSGARASAAALLAAFPAHRLTARAAFRLFEALLPEQEAAERAGDAARANALKRERAGYARVSNRLAPAPSFGNLRAEAALWLELGEFAAAEETLRATIASAADEPERAADVERFVKPDLALALLGQHRAREAFELLDPLLPEDASGERMPSATVVRAWCRAVAGWVEGGGGASGAVGSDCVEVEGVGGDLARATRLLGELVAREKASGGAWTCPWYELVFEHVHALARWGERDPSRRSAVRDEFDALAIQLGDPELRDVAARCGDEALRARFLSLRARLR